MPLLVKLSKLRDEIQQSATGLSVGLISPLRAIEPSKIVVTSHHGNGYGCNPKYITEELLRAADIDLDIVWLLKEFDTSLPSGIRQVKFGSHAAMMELATAKVWIDNCRTRRHVRKRKGQYYIQAWHGGTPLKLIEQDAAGGLSKLYLYGAKRDSKEADLMYANSDFLFDLIRNKFWYTGEIVRCGLPRNTPLFADSEPIKKRVYETFHINEDCRLCLYAPTFRDSHSLDPYVFDYRRCCQALSERFGGKFIFAMRLHPNVAYLCDRYDNADIINFSSYGDAQELLVAADVLISDYSTITEDYSLTGKPCYLYAPDFDDYMQERNMYFPLERTAFPVAYDEETLFKNIATITTEELDQKRSAYFDMVGMHDDGKGAQCIAGIVLDVIKGIR